MSQQLTDLTTQVAQNTTVEASAVTLIKGLAAQIVAAGTDPVALQALHDSLNTSATALAAAIAAIPGLDRTRLLVFGGWESASRGAGSTLQMVGERLAIAEQFQGVDQVTVGEDGSLEILERIEGGRHQVSVCAAPPAVLGWATGNLPEPRNNPQIGMANMRAIMPALQRAKPTPIPNTGLSFASVNLPRQQRETRIVKDMPAQEIAREIVAWMAEE